jgi:type I restriction enzyme R subunit
MLRLNRSRAQYLERLQRLIEEYNAGSKNVEIFFQELIELTQELSAEEQRTVAESLSEEELALFDLLTKPEIELTEKERQQVKHAARDLLTTLKEQKLVLDWRKRQQTRAEVLLAIEVVLDADLPRRFDPSLYRQKCDAIYEHIYDSYYGPGQSIYTSAA